MDSDFRQQNASPFLRNVIGFSHTFNISDSVDSRHTSSIIINRPSTYGTHGRLPVPVPEAHRTMRLHIQYCTTYSDGTLQP